MNNIFEIYDPTNLRVYSLNANELRFWLDIPKLQQDYSNIQELRQSFSSLETDKREYLLKLMDKHDSTIPFEINHWEGIPGVDVVIELTMQYVNNASSNYDVVNGVIRDGIFYNKNIKTLPQNANIFIENKYFPVRAIFGISEDFWEKRDLSTDNLFPVFDQDWNADPQNQTRILLDRSGEMKPVNINVPLMTIDNWVYQLNIQLKPSLDSSLVLWPNIPNTKKLHEFFDKMGYIVNEETGKRIIWEHKEEGNVVEYNLPPAHLYQPFVVVRKHRDKEDFKSREELGSSLIKKMRETGIWDDILYYRAYLLETEALGKIQNKNKTTADILLSDAIMGFDECDMQNLPLAQSEAIFCAWLKSRIAKGKEDNEVEYRSYRSIAKRLADGHLWKEFTWFIDKVYQEDRKMPQRIIKDFLPMNKLDKYYFVDQKSYKQILEFWDYAYAKEKRPESIPPSQWHYTLSKEAFEIGLKDTARSHLIKFFKVVEKDRDRMTWLVDGVEELMEYSIKLDLKERYLTFAQTVVRNIEAMKKSEGIGDMTAIGRKAYRWSLLTMTLSESRFALHAAVLLSKTNRAKPEVSREWLKKSYETFREATLHYDATEEYTEDQLSLIGKGFVTVYHLGYNLKDEYLMGYAQQLSTEIWWKMPTRKIYQAIHSIFSKERREEMADSLIGDWIQEVTEEEGEFSLNVERTIELSSLYLGVEEWEESAKTLKYGLEHFTWDFENLNKVFEIFLDLKHFAPDKAELCHNQLLNWIYFHMGETNKFKETVRPMIQRLNKIPKV